MLNGKIVSLNLEKEEAWQWLEKATSEDLDALRIVPRWQAAKDLSKLKGQTVRVKFTLENANLYAFQVR